MADKLEFITDLVNEHCFVTRGQADEVADLLFDYYGSEDEDVLQTIVEDAIRFIDFDRLAENVVEDYAYDLMHDIYEIPDFLENYVDYKAFARDLELGGDIAVLENKNVVIIIDNFAF